MNEGHQRQMQVRLCFIKSYSFQTERQQRNAASEAAAVAATGTAEAGVGSM
jgi:hypothetical protein